MAVGVTCVSADIHDESEFKHTLALVMHEIGRQYSDAGYVGRFFD